MESPFASSSHSSSSGPSVRPAVTPAAFFALLPALLGAVLVGAAYHFVARWLDLVVLFPIMAGMMVGGALAGLAKRNKVRSKAALTVLAIAGGLLCYGTREFCDSLYDRSHTLPAYARRLAGTNVALQASIETRLRARYTPLRYFPLYLQDAAERGISISSTHDGSKSSSNAPITGAGFWAFFVLDGLLIAGSAIAVAWKQADAPFCLTCDNWHGAERTLSRWHPSQGPEAVDLAKSGKWEDLGNLRGQGVTDKLHTDLLLAKCPGCGVGALKIRSTRGKGGKTLWKGAAAAPDVTTLETVRAQWLK